MAVQVSVEIKVLQGDGSVIVASERSFMALNDKPRDQVNDGDIAKERLADTLKEMGEEADSQIDTWKAAMMNLLGGGS